jgi:hypothetical protein
MMNKALILVLVSLLLAVDKELTVPPCVTVNTSQGSVLSTG